MDGNVLEIELYIAGVFPITWMHFFIFSWETKLWKRKVGMATSVRWKIFFRQMSSSLLLWKIPEKNQAQTKAMFSLFFFFFFFFSESSLKWFYLNKVHQHMRSRGYFFFQAWACCSLFMQSDFLFTKKKKKKKKKKEDAAHFWWVFFLFSPKLLLGHLHCSRRKGSTWQKVFDWIHCVLSPQTSKRTGMHFTITNRECSKSSYIVMFAR